MSWIRTKDKLPEEGKYVFARHDRGTWSDSSDQDNVNCVVVKLKKGISAKERELLGLDCERARAYYSEDEGFNNLVPYNWDSFGSDSFFGQDITHWLPIPSND